MLRDWKDIERSREIRLWLTQVGIPAGLALVWFKATHPDFFTNFAEKVRKVFRKDVAKNGDNT